MGSRGQSAGGGWGAYNKNSAEGIKQINEAIDKAKANGESDLADMLAKQKDMIASQPVKASQAAKLTSEDLDALPDGTKITGIINASTGKEAIVEKRTVYKAIYGGVGAGSRIPETNWYVNGVPDPYFRRILSGKNKYYKIKGR